MGKGTFKYKSLLFLYLFLQLHQEACLILAVQAVQQMVICELPYLTSFLEIFLAFGVSPGDGLQFEEIKVDYI